MIDLARLRQIAGDGTGSPRTDKVVRDGLAYAEAHSSDPVDVLAKMRARGDRLNEAFMDMSRRPDAPEYRDVDAWSMAACRDAIMNMASVVERAAARHREARAI